MEGEKFNKQALDQMFDDVFSSDKPVCYIKSNLEGRLIERLKASLKARPRWDMEEFLAFFVAFRFLAITSEEKKCKHEESYLLLTRTNKDIKSDIIANNDFYKKSLSSLKELIKKNEVGGTLLPIEWLELAEEKDNITYSAHEILPETSLELFKVHHKLATFIRYSHYNLDFNLADKGCPTISRLSLVKAADLLDTEISNVILDSLYHCDFGIYCEEIIEAKNSKIEATITYSSNTTRSKINQIIDSSYRYNHEGIVRLRKYYDNQENITIKQFLKGGSIGNIDKKFSDKVDESVFLTVLLQPSVAQACRGHFPCVNLSSGQRITENNCFLLEKEFEKSYAVKVNLTQKSLRKSIIRSSKKTSVHLKDSLYNYTKNQLHKLTEDEPSKMIVFIDALQVIFEIIKTVDPDFDFHKIPGKLSDLHKFCLEFSPTIFFGGSLIDTETEKKLKTFGKYCTGRLPESTISKRPQANFCAWEKIGRARTSNKAYYAQIISKLKQANLSDLNN